MKTIVVGDDFSEASRLAVDQAIALARHHDATLVIVHGTGLTDFAAAMGEPTLRNARPWRSYVHERTETAREKLLEKASRCRGDGVRAFWRLSHDLPDVAISGAARDVGADLVVVGSHRRTSAERLLTCSVSERVVRECTRSVLIARYEVVTPQRLLVATDFSPAAERALAFALLLAAPSAEIEVVHCWEPPTHGGTPAPEPVLARLRERARDRGQELVAHHRSNHPRINFTLTQTRPASGILSRVENGRFDMVIVGRRGRRDELRPVIGTVAAEVARTSLRSALVVNPADWSKKAP